MQEESASRLQRVLQGIRKINELGLESGKSTPLSSESDTLRASSTSGKENSAPGIDRSDLLDNPFSLSPESLELSSHNVSLTAETNESTNDQSTNSTVPHHRNKYGENLELYM